MILLLIPRGLSRPFLGWFEKAEDLVEETRDYCRELDLPLPNSLKEAEKVATTSHGGGWLIQTPEETVKLLDYRGYNETLVRALFREAVEMWEKYRGSGEFHTAIAYDSQLPGNFVRAAVPAITPVKYGTGILQFFDELDSSNRVPDALALVQSPSDIRFWGREDLQAERLRFASTAVENPVAVFHRRDGSFMVDISQGEILAAPKQIDPSSGELVDSKWLPCEGCLRLVAVPLRVVSTVCPRCQRSSEN